MKRKYSEAARAKRSMKDAYIDGLTDDEQADELQAWHDANAPEYEAIKSGHHFDDVDEKVPF